MRVAFVVPRFGTDAPTAPERLAEQLAASGSDRWRINVLAVASGIRKGRPLKPGMVQVGKFRIHRFAADDDAAAPDALTAAGLTGHLESEAYDAILLFGAGAAACRAAARAAASRTVLIPFAPEEPGECDREAFERAGAILFGSDAEEKQALSRYAVDRKMRETVETPALLPVARDPEGFRQRTGIRGRHLVCADSPSDRVVRDFVRLFHAFRDSQPKAQLDLVVLGAPPPGMPRRPDTRFVAPSDAEERLDAVAGALMQVMPGRLTPVAAAVEPFSLGIPILVSASAADLVAECQASNGGLYYRDYPELELILDLGLRDPALFGRLGEAGRNHLAKKGDWDALVSQYDRAIRSFARPSRGEEPPPVPPPEEPEPEPPPEPGPEPEPKELEQPEEPDGLPSFFRGTIQKD